MELDQLPSSVRLMAVTKGRTVAEILSIVKNYKINLIGESRWQEAQAKLAYLPSNIEKHFIGHLQTNKAREVVQYFDCIESVDSVRLAQVINAEAGKINKAMPIFLQVNISHDPKKFGIPLKDVASVSEQLKQFEHISLEGFMAITAYNQTQKQTRQDFAKMRILQQHHNLPELSMGMSDNWQIAVEEGATIVRLGRALSL